MSVDPAVYADRLRQQPIFAVWSPAELVELLRVCQLQSHADGEVLFVERDPASQFFFLDVGIVELFSTSIDGKEKILEIMQAGDLFAEAVAFMEGKYPVTARCQGRCKILQIPFAPFVAILDRDPRLMRRILAQLSMRLHFLVKEVRMRSIESANRRVCNYLLELSESAAPQADFSLPAKKVSIAARLGLTPETFSRVLRRLKDAHAIDMQGQHIVILDRKKLLAISLA